MALNYTSDIMALFNSKVGNDANYQAPGNFGLTAALTGSVGVASVTIDTPGVYTTVPTATAATGAATFSTRMKLLSGSTFAAAGTGYAPGNVLSLVGGTKTTTATVTVATVKLVSATIAAGGTGYGAASTFTVSVAGGTHSVTATVSVTTSGGGVVTTINSVNAAGSYTVLPTLLGNAVTGDNGTDHGTGLTLNLVFGINTFTVSQAGVYSALPSNPISTTVAPAGGTGATLTGSWAVNSLVVTAPGAYELGVAPLINFSSGSAAATAVLAVATTADTDTKKILMMVEVVRSLLAETTNHADVKEIHEILRKMMMKMKFGGAPTFSAATTASSAQSAAMHYFANNLKHNAVI